MKQRCLLSLVLLFVTSPVAHAMWVDTFAGGAPQQTWVYAALPDGFSYTQSYFSDGVQMESTSPVGTGAVAVFGVVPDMFDSNVRVRAVVNPNNVSNLSRNLGVLAHMNPVTGDGYSFTIKYDDEDPTIDISKIEGAADDNLGHADVPGFSMTESYILELDVIGTHLTGRIYDSSENLLTTISAIDNDPYTSGYAGIATQRELTDSTLLGMFGMVSAIPEPSSFLLVVLAVLAWSLHRRNRTWMSA